MMKQVNSVMNQYKIYKFDNIVTKISITQVIQHIDDHNLIYSIDQICFACLNRLKTNKTSQ